MAQHEELAVYKKSIDLVEYFYQISKFFPESESFGLTSQLRRAAISIALNISEGCARNTIKENLQFLYISRGSLNETKTIILIAFRLNYLIEEQFKEANHRIDEVSKLLGGFIKYKKSVL